MLAEWALLAAGLGVTAVATLQARAARRELAALDGQVRRSAMQLAELMRYAAGHEQLAELQALAEQGVDGTTALVRDIHRAIATIPFTVLEQFPATRDTSRLVRGLHDLTADGVYGSISAINRGVGRGLRSRLRRPPPDAD